MGARAPDHIRTVEAHASMRRHPSWTGISATHPTVLAAAGTTVAFSRRRPIRTDSLMFRDCRHRQTVLVSSLALIALLSACSERHPQPPPAMQATEHETAESPDAMRVTVTAAGIRTRYAAYFNDDRLERIVESREPAGDGEYVFYGARLMQYKGAALNSPAQIELTFDMQSGIATRSGNIDALSDAEIGAIRNRAELLRSLALARRSTQSHTAGQETHR